ncbi:MAG: transglutaminase family protein [Gammaproteobacteria bacterium]|nr:transglutaminase family protein [Gammaproteobacteria bacterium]
MRKLRIRHVTRYRYAEPVTFHPHTLLLRPREGHDIRIESSELSISPAHSALWHRDVHGNSVAVVSFQEPATELVFESAVVIEHYEDVPLKFTLEPYAERYPFHYDAAERPDLAPYMQTLFTKDDASLRTWSEEFWKPDRVLPTYELLETMNRAIPARFQYRMREEPGVQRPSETLALGGGSCRDFATLFMETCRHIGLAARFVSGYLYAPNLPAAQGATHAWSEVYLPGAGWRGFDSTTGTLVGGDHIAVAVARHPESVPPVSGSFEGNSGPPPAMEVEVAVDLLA